MLKQLVWNMALQVQKFLYIIFSCFVITKDSLPKLFLHAVSHSTQLPFVPLLNTFVYTCKGNPDIMSCSHLFGDISLYYGK